jgi:hypothetical protein
MAAYRWQCPFCQSFTVVDDSDVASTELNFGSTKHGRQRFGVQVIRCQNSECQEYELKASLVDLKKVPLPPLPGQPTSKEVPGPVRKVWPLIPGANIKPFPSYIPGVLLADYREACEIRDLSPRLDACHADP